jgi:long-chain fatty acid transport protein
MGLWCLSPRERPKRPAATIWSERARAARALLCVFLLTPAGAALAQESGAPEVGFSSIPFQFFPPGARSLAMGATFIGIADDATAAASNPAGLIILTKAEASAHGRFTSFPEFSEGGYRSPGSSAISPSYVSIVVPRKPFSFSAYYQQVSKIDIDRHFAGNVRFANEAETTPFESTSRIDVLLSDVGLSGAVNLGHRVSVGGTLGVRRLKLTYLNENTIAGDFSFNDRASSEGTDDTLVFSLGVLANPNGRFSAGAVYKRGGRFELPYTVDFDGSLDGPVSCPSSGVCAAGALEIPDTWGIGAGFRPSGKWLIAADASLVRYSQLSPTLFRGIPFDIYPPSSNELPPAPFDDVVQIHVGVERGFVGNPTFLVRAGAYRRPDFNKAGVVDAGAFFATFGGGVVFGDRGQLDGAVNLSRDVKEGLLSLVVRF